MCFHSNQHPWATKHPFINLYSKYQPLKYICLPVMNSPVFPSLDDIYCTHNRVFKPEREQLTDGPMDRQTPNHLEVISP